MTKQVYRRIGLASALAAAIALSACGERQGSVDTPAPSSSIQPSPSADQPTETPKISNKGNDTLADTFVLKA